MEKEFSNSNISLLYSDSNPVFFKKFVGLQDEVPGVFADSEIDGLSQSVHRIKGEKIVQKQIYLANQFRPSMFKSHELQVNHMNRNVQPETNITWLSGLILVVLILFAFVRVHYFKKLQQVVKAFSVFRFFNQFVREENIFRERYSYPLALIFLINVSIFLFCSFQYYIKTTLFGWQSFYVYIAISGMIVCWCLFKFIAIALLGYLFKSKKEAIEHTASLVMLLHVSGILFLPLTVLAVFSFSWYIYIAGFFLFVILYLYFIIKTAFIQMANSNFSLLNIFLYLCTLEIIPLLFLTKILYSKGLL